MKKTQITVIISFAAALTILCFCSLFTDADGFSPLENRYLSRKPEFSLSEYFSGDFMDEYENFLLDNFLLRDFSIRSFQSYSDLMYIDIVPDEEIIVANVDVDEFVTAGGQQGASDDAVTGAYSGPAMDSDQQSERASGETAAENAVHRSDNNSVPYSNDIVTGADGNAGEAQPGDGRLPGAGQHLREEARRTLDEGVRTENTGGTGMADQQPGHDAGQVISGQEDGTDAAGGNGTEKDHTNENNSLIIAGDRIMMPTGAYNLDQFGKILSDFAELMPELNLYSVTGPTSAAFYASPRYSTGRYDQSRAEDIIAGSADGVTVVRVFDKLMKHKDENIYFRSDVHWTALGAYYAYTAFCEASGLEPGDIDADFVKYTYEPFLGGLYSQIYQAHEAARLRNNPEQLDYYIPRLGHQLTLYKMGNLDDSYKVSSIINTDFESLGAYKYSCFAWGDQRIERIDTDNPGGRKLLVIKDSYGSCLVPFLVHNYSLIYVIDPKGFNNETSPGFDAKELINEEGIEDVLFCFSIYGSGRKIIRDSLAGLLLQ